MLGVLAAVVLPAHAGAQTANGGTRESDLRARVVLAGAPTFGRIRAARELADGRVLVSDEREHALRLVSAPHSGATTVPNLLGRTGDGPNEYRNPGDMMAVGDDTTVVTDANTGRWYVLDGSTFVALPPAWRTPQTAARNAARGMARRGDALMLSGASTGRAGQRVPTGWVGDADSVFAIVVRISGARDTVARLAGHPSGALMVNARVNGANMMHKVRNPLATYDQAVMFADGTVAIARSSPYRVSMLRADGRRVDGPALEISGGDVSAAVRERAAAGYVRNDDGSGVFRASQLPNWPRTVPAFTSAALVAGGDGRLYVSRTRLHPDDELYVDVFDATAERVGRLRLPARARLVGVSARHLLLAIRNADDEDVLVMVAMSAGGAVSAQSMHMVTLPTAERIAARTFIDLDDVARIVEPKRPLADSANRRSLTCAFPPDAELLPVDSARHMSGFRVRRALGDGRRATTITIDKEGRPTTSWLLCLRPSTRCRAPRSCGVRFALLRGNDSRRRNVISDHLRALAYVAFSVALGLTAVTVADAQRAPTSQFTRSHIAAPPSVWLPSSSSTRVELLPQRQLSSDSMQAGPYVLIGAAAGGTLGYLYAHNRFPPCDDCIGRGYLLAATTIASALGGYAVGGIVFLVRREFARRTVAQSMR
jgi:hypothetical protein